MNINPTKAIALKTFLLMLSVITASVAQSATLEIEVVHDGGCLVGSICSPVTQFNVYDSEANQLGIIEAETGGTLTFEQPVVAGQEYCFDVAAVNLFAEGPTARGCVTAGDSAPGITTIIRVEFQ